MAMMAPVPSSGWKDWRNHMAEKSPKVQPTRQRVVLRPALRHVEGDDQKSSDVGDGVDLGHGLGVHDEGDGEVGDDACEDDLVQAAL